MKELERVWTVILLEGSWLAFWFPLASRQSPVGGLFLPLPCAWETVTCEQRSILTWWPPASTEGLSAGEAGVSCRGWQHLWASLVKFSDSVPLGITELMNLTSSGGLKALSLLAGLLWKQGQGRAGKEEESAHGMAGGGMWVAESSWYGAELGTCRQRS